MTEKTRRWRFVTAVAVAVVLGPLAVSTAAQAADGQPVTIDDDTRLFLYAAAAAAAIVLLIGIITASVRRRRGKAGDGE